MENEIWIERYGRIEASKPVAVVGSPGLRSIGQLVVDQLISGTEGRLIATLYSTHLPLIYQTKPSYASNPTFPGIGGVKIQLGELDFPKVEFFTSSFPPLIIARGWNANFDGQYDIAERVLNFFSEFKVRRIIVVAGYGSKEKRVCCAATNLALMNEMRENFKIEADYQGPFYGFSGLVFGLAKRKNTEAICLFAGTEPKPEEPEFPDAESCRMILDTLFKMLPLTQQTSSRKNHR